VLFSFPQAVAYAEAKLTPQNAEAADLERVSFNEKSFRFEMNGDPIATERMAEAIRRFSVDTRKLQEIVESKL
jgi:transaldolase